VDAEVARWSWGDNMPSNPNLELGKLGVLVATVQAEFNELSQILPSRTSFRSELLRMITLYQKALDL
jgi:hypothetical protein